jgi:prefoldin alpha subunit
MSKDQEVSRNLTLIEYYKEQLTTLDAQLQYLQAAVADFYKAKITVEQLCKTTENHEILIPIGGGSYLSGLLKDNAKVLVDIGAGLVTERSHEDAVKKIQQRITALQENQQKLLTLAQKIEQEAAELSEKTQKMMDDSN